ncbi:hypothetical protein [Bradyrhizobium sp. UFLA05-112]
MTAKNPSAAGRFREQFMLAVSAALLPTGQMSAAAKVTSVPSAKQAQRIQAEITSLKDQE